MNHLKFLFFILISSSCSPVMYSPTTQNVPLLKQKGEVNIEAGLSSTEDADGFNLKAAVAVDSSLAVAASYNTLNGGTKNSNDTWHGQARYFEAAVGKFGSSERGPWVYEAFLGVGYASVKNEKNPNGSLGGPKELVKGKFIKPYIQPSIGIRSKYVDFAVTPRIALVNYIYDQVNVTDEQDAQSSNDFFKDKKSTFVFEPGATLRVGFKGVKLQIQYVYSSFSYDSQLGSYNPEILSIGLNLYPK